MKESLSIKVVRPRSVLRKSLKINAKELSKAIGKAGANAVFGKWEGLAGNAVDVLSSLGLKTGVSESAWLLLYRGVLSAIKQTTEEVIGLQLDASDVSALHDLVVTCLDKESVTLDKRFFSHPESHSLVEEVAEEYQKWLAKQGLRSQDAKSVSVRLRTYIAYCLHEEWATAASTYNQLQTVLDTPFTQATTRSFGWLRYSAWLNKQVDQRLFLEAFSLRQIYVPLRAYFRQKAIPDAKLGYANEESLATRDAKVVVDLKTELESWVGKADARDAVRLISGGPGSGKSSFAKIFAATHKFHQEVSTLFIPLHHFELMEDLVEAVGRYVKIQDILAFNPLDWERGEQRLLIIFDGLDELSMQGRVGERNAQEFVREVLRKLDQFNQSRLKVQVLVTGRELVIQSSETFFRKEGQVLTVLPYFIAENEHDSSYLDDKGLLAVDQREVWWGNYAKITGGNFVGMPKELDRGNLVEITAQPLLNYLVALAVQRGQLQLSETTNLNAIYADLLRAIHERGWSSGPHVTTQGLDEHQFVRVLEEIALASWHGDGRTTTVKEIESHCVQSGLSALLNRFQQGLQSDPRLGVTQLLTAFYFRQSGHDATGERTFEFTHKSFGEYLTAKRIVRELRMVDKKLRENDENSDEGLNIRNAVQRWIALTGATAIDDYVFAYICGEAEMASGEALAWQKTLCRLLEYVLSNGLPIEYLAPRPSYAEECKIAKNVEESFLVVLNACARATKTISKIRWPSELSFGELMRRIVGQRAFDQKLVLKCLGYLDLQHCILISQDFWQSDFQYSDLSFANLVGSDCRYSDFSHTILCGASLVYGNFIKCNFEFSVLGGAEEEDRANLTGGLDHSSESVRENLMLDGASFKGANLEGVSFVGLDVRTVNFDDAMLTNSDFSGALISEMQQASVKGRGALVKLSIVESEADRLAHKARFKSIARRMRFAR